MFELHLSTGTVRKWQEDEGWGVIDSPHAPGGCLAIFHSIQMLGFRKLTAGETVEFEWVRGSQEGFGYQAEKVWPPGVDKDYQVPADHPDGAYSSDLEIIFNEDH
ncbi:cold-shock protein [Candidatus Frankia alpina]|uniref:Cold shock domain-containing protein n=1 Tax=Candidatus Frankia alpina TaxID=2699483 RepID=A0A4S5CPU5_9ACTN|nr:cold shock domain-containing protein [Candidatus Frankia alpina]THJ48174.1 cold shock domain-containing protein [Candidatus Frankia alpina]